MAGQWGDALPALSAYIDELDRAKEVADTIAAGKAAGDLGFDDVRKSVEDLNVELADLVSKMQSAGADDETILALQDAWNKVSKAAQGRKQRSFL